jgi:CheY-like chemotaxis protein
MPHKTLNVSSPLQRVLGKENVQSITNIQQNIQHKSPVMQDTWATKKASGMAGSQLVSAVQSVPNVPSNYYKPLHIVIADDDESDCMNFRDALGELRIKTVVHTLNDGVELMEYLDDIMTPLPELLFLDINMPRKNGLECLKEIRNSEKLRLIAIAIYSTSASEKDIEETFLNGANVYIKKPNDFINLKKALGKIIEQAHIYRDPPFNVQNFIFKV